MGFHNNRKIRVRLAVERIRPAFQPHPDFRVGEVSNGQVPVTIYDRKITPQKAYALATKAAGQKVKFFGSMIGQQTTPTFETRVYNLV